MINLKQLERLRELATIDKADLFDFYHKNWDALVAEIEELRPEHREYSHGEAMAKMMPSLRTQPGHPDYDPE